MGEPKKEWRREYLKKALLRLYAGDSHLIQEGKERPAAARLACHLRDILTETRYLRTFPEIRIDVDYGREGRDVKRNPGGQHVVPDIIVHVPGCGGPNVVVAEVKAYWNASGRQADRRKLADYKTEQRYAFAYLIELECKKGTIEKI